MHAETPARPPGTNGSGALLSVHGLTISFGADDGDGAALEAVDLELGAGEVLGVVGASGSGKSTLALALLGMLDPPGRRRAGGVRFDGRELFESSRAELDRIRGGQIALVFQEPLTAFNPVWTVGEQIAEGLRLHAGLDGRAARGRAIEALAEVGLPDPGGVARRYPHQLSGGMRQRAMIAMAIAPRPRVLVADEPTTALDATLRGELLGLFGRLAREHGLTLVLVSHDLGAVAQVAERAVVLERGRVVEQGTVEELFERPQHAATRALVGAAVRLALPPGVAPAGAPVIGGEAAPARELELLRPERPPLLELAELEVVHPGRRRWLRREADVDAVRGVSLRVGRGEVVALVGESGCGKSTLARCAVGLVEPRGGAVVYHGPASEGPARQSLFALDPARRRALLARRVGIVFQDPVSSLNPRHRVLRIVGEAPRVHGLLAGPGQSRGADGREGDELARPLVERWLARVGLEPAAADRYPHEFSGGERQRIALARALATEPELLILDEATSSLDAAVRAEVLELIDGLVRELGLAVLLVSHDLGVVRSLAERVAVMYAGQLVEVGRTHELFERAAHPYTRLLLSAHRPFEGGVAARGQATPAAPSAPGAPAEPGSAGLRAGCAFAPRCPLAEPRCRELEPPERVSGTHRARCHLVVDEGARPPHGS